MSTIGVFLPSHLLQFGHLICYLILHLLDLLHLRADAVHQLLLKMRKGGRNMIKYKYLLSFLNNKCYHLELLKLGSITNFKLQLAPFQFHSSNWVSQPFYYHTRKFGPHRKQYTVHFTNMLSILVFLVWTFQAEMSGLFIRSKDGILILYRFPMPGLHTQWI